MNVEKEFIKDVEETTHVLLDGHKTDRHIEYKKKMNPLLYWMSLVVAIIGNIFVSILFIPFLLFLKGFPLYTIIIILGVVFGMLFNLLVKDIEYIDYRHHVVSGIFIPAIAAVDFYYIVKVSNTIGSKLTNAPHQDPIMISVVYVLAFVAPYVIYKLGALIKVRKAAA